MPTTSTRPPTSASAGATTSPSVRTSLAAGVLAGPLLALVWLAQAVTRDGYDVTRHPMSLLARGEGGFVQVSSFVVCGLLVVLLARGCATVFRGGVGRTWLPRLVALCGIGLVGAGVFRADAGAGFPAGAPEGAPSYTAVGVLHEVCFVVVMLAWVATLAVLLRRARQQRDRWLRGAVVSCFLLVLVLSAVPHVDSFPVRTVVASAVQLAFLAVVAVREHRRSGPPA